MPGGPSSEASYLAGNAGSITHLPAASFVWFSVSLWPSIPNWQSREDELMTATHQINVRPKDNNTCEASKAAGYTDALYNLGPTINHCCWDGGMAWWQSTGLVCENPRLHHQYQNQSTKSKPSSVIAVIDEHKRTYDSWPGSGNFQNTTSPLHSKDIRSLLRMLGPRCRTGGWEHGLKKIPFPLKEELWKKSPDLGHSPVPTMACSWGHLEVPATLKHLLDLFPGILSKWLG